jgi:hypothetical protein
MVHDPLELPVIRSILMVFYNIIMMNGYYALTNRIEENAEENLFRPALRTLTPWVRENGLYCVCNSLNRVNEALCSPTQYLECSKTGSITKSKCRINGRRKRRAGNHSSKEIHRIMSKIAVQFSSRKMVGSRSFFYITGFWYTAIQNIN